MVKRNEERIKGGEKKTSTSFRCNSGTVNASVGLCSKNKNERGEKVGTKIIEMNTEQGRHGGD